MSREWEVIVEAYDMAKYRLDKNEITVDFACGMLEGAKDVALTMNINDMLSDEEYDKVQALYSEYWREFKLR